MGGVRLMQRRDGDELLDPDFARAIGHPVRVVILKECSVAPISVSELRKRRKLRMSRQAVEHHVSTLVRCGAIEEVASRKERGGRAKYYAATAGAIFSEEDFGRLPPALQGSLSAAACSTLYERIEESLLAGTLDAHPERHLTWSPLELDWTGLLQIIEELDDIFARLEAVVAESRLRMSLTGEEPLHATVAMMAFESPAPLRDHRVNRELPPP